MLKEWQFNSLFMLGVGGTALLLLAPIFGIDLKPHPGIIAELGAVLGFILTQKRAIVKPKKKVKTGPKKEKK